MDYSTLKHLHIGCAALSGSVFLLRSVCMLRDSPILNWRTVKILPHIIDTLLLASALVLVSWSEQYPFIQGWLTAKVLALIIYIVLGSIALKSGRTKTIRVYALLGAIATFAYIGMVATTRHWLVFT